MPSSPTSGSAKLSYAPADVKRLVLLLKKLKTNPDIIINGTPRPDWIKGSFAAPSSDSLATVLTELLKLGGTYKPVKLFPKGKPAIDQILVNFELRAK